MRAGALEETEVHIPSSPSSSLPFDDEAMKMMNNIMVVMQQQVRDEDEEKKGKKMKIKDARNVLTQGAMDEVISEQGMHCCFVKLLFDVSLLEIVREALLSAQSDGIIVIDEIDKVCTPKDTVYRHADASSEGVQRDLLPIVEGVFK